MPNSQNGLLDMFQPTDPIGKPAGWNDAIAPRSNSLIGLGLGLLSPTQPGSGQTGFTQGLRGLMAGSQADTRNAEHRQQVARQATQDARQAAMDRFNIGREPEAIRTMRASGVDPASPEGRALLYPKTDEWKEGKVTYREQDYPYRANLRTGQYEWGPMGPPPGQGAARSDTAAAPYASGAAIPFVGGGGVPSSSGAWPPTATATATAAAPITTRSDYPPDFDNWLPSAQKAYEAERAKKLAQETVKSPQQEQAAKQSASNVLSALDTAEQQAANKGGFFPTTGLVGGALKHVYQPAKDLEKTLDTIKANVSIDKLSAMRAASTTGASGLGAVTESEHKLLQASIAALDQEQSPEQFMANLKRVRATYEWIVNRTDANQPPPFSLRQDPSQGTGTPSASGGGRTFIRDPSGKIVPQ